jgi:hypothetical protein
MQERSVRGQQQHSEAACTEESSAFTVEDRLAATIPMVRARGQLFLQPCTSGRIRRARRLIGYLARTERDPSTLYDAFYVRVGFAPVGRLRADKIRVSPLKQSSSATPGTDGSRR